MQARAWCSHEGGNTTISGNCNGLPSCEVLDRPLFASAAADVSRAEQKEKVKAVAATADQISRAPWATATTGSGSAKLSRSKGRERHGPGRLTGKKKHHATLLATQPGKEACSRNHRLLGPPSQRPIPAGGSSDPKMICLLMRYTPMGQHETGRIRSSCDADGPSW